VIVALHVGPVEVQSYNGREVRTAAHKRSVQAAMLTPLGFEGDEQAERRYHGGPDKAVCVYPAEHYDFWRTLWGVDWAFGAFGENLAISGFREKDVCIGDILSVGEATVQVTQPRQPCSKLVSRHGRPELIETIQRNGFSGYYLRVLEAGFVRVGYPIALKARDPGGVTVQFANQVMFRQLPDRESLERILAVPALSAAWRETLSKRL
jgi:MOSC domain-containing protein YiiM